MINKEVEDSRRSKRSLINACRDDPEKRVFKIPFIRSFRVRGFSF